MSVLHILYFTHGTSTELSFPEELNQQSYRVQTVTDLSSARNWLKSMRFQVGVMDLSGKSPVEHLRAQEELLDCEPTLAWIALVNGRMAGAEELRKPLSSQFFDYHVLPLGKDLLYMSMNLAANMSLLMGSATTEHSHGMVGKSAAMSQVFRNLGKAATSTYPVLLCGENGTGKELLARAIHRASPRRRKNFIAVDCAMPFSAEQLAQWFEPPQPGVRGGNHRSTHGGTLFFNNLDDLPLDGQNRLLAHLPESGATEGCAADVRIIAATRTQLEARVAEGRFHADLYGRIHVLCQTLPPLRQRDNDILLLAQHFLRQERGPNSPLLGFTSQAVDAMIRHTWPGNARELLNRVRRAVVLSENRMISPADLDLACGAPISGQVMKLQEARLEAEKNAIRAAMRMCGNNLSLAAKALDISRMTLYRLLQRNAAEPIDLPETELRIRRPRKNLRLKSSTPIPLAYSGKDR